MDYKDEQHNEIEALESIYCGELESMHGMSNNLQICLYIVKYITL